MITFEMARQSALAQLGPTWEHDDCGDYVAADYGYEDASAWLLIDGGHRLVVDGDLACEPIGRPSTLVDKTTGEVFFLSYLQDPDRFEAMTSVGHHPQNDMN